MNQMATLSLSHVESIWAEWFGGGGRELGDPSRWFSSDPENLIRLAIACQGQRPIFCSQSIYSGPDQVSTLDRILFDFDSKDDLDKAWIEVREFANRLQTFWSIEPLVCFSGSKGYHAHVFLESPYVGTSLKDVYAELCRMLKGSRVYQTLDPQPLGDYKRLARVPLTVHQASGKLCQPVDLDRVPLVLESGFVEHYRRHGIGKGMVEKALLNIEDQRKETERRKSRRRTSSSSHENNLRPCIKAALDGVLNEKRGHLIRLAITREYQAAGWSNEAIANLFKGQPDFSFEKSLHYIKASGSSKPFTCERITELGYCLGSSCPIYRRHNRR